MIDISKIKPGDEVTVRGTVARLCPAKDRAVEVRLPYGGYEFFSYSDIDTHMPTAIAAGDTVRLVNGRQAAVMAINSGWAWVLPHNENGPGVVHSVGLLERVS